MIRLGWKTLRHDGECVGVMFGLAWGLSDWKRDELEGPEFGLRPRGLRWRLARRRQVRALSRPGQERPGYPVLQPRLPPRPRFSSVSSKLRQGRETRSGWWDCR